MQEIHLCNRSSTTTPCHASVASADPIDVADALARFDREATQATLDTGRYRMPYYVWGQGPPLIFIHGVADTALSYRLVISRLASHFRCIAYTQPQGRIRGQSGDGSNLWHYQHEHLVQDLWALCDHLKLDRAYLLGSSFGSTIALEAMRDRPQRVPRAILQSGVAHRRLGFAEGIISWWLRFFPGPMAKLIRRDRILDRVHKPPFEGLPPARWQAFVEWTSQARLAALGHQVRMLDRLDLRPHLPSIHQPILLMHCDRDPVMPRRHAEQLLAGLPSAGMVVIDGCGHVPCYTHPETMAEVIRQFLTPPPPPGSCDASLATCSGPATCSAAQKATCPGPVDNFAAPQGG